jgi:hypothetical protein
VVASGGKPEATVYGTAAKLPAAWPPRQRRADECADWCALQPPAHTTPYVIPPAMALAGSTVLGQELIAAPSPMNCLPSRRSRSATCGAIGAALRLRRGLHYGPAPSLAPRILGLDAQE